MIDWKASHAGYEEFHASEMVQGESDELHPTPHQLLAVLYVGVYDGTNETALSLSVPFSLT